MGRSGSERVRMDGLIGGGKGGIAVAEHRRQIAVGCAGAYLSLYPLDDA